MERIEFKEKLVGKNFFFINQLVKQLGGSKKGNKAQDVEEILAFFDADADKTVSAFDTLEATKKARFAKIKDFFAEIRENWETLVTFVSQNESIPQPVQDAIEKIDAVIDAIFGSK